MYEHEQYRTYSEAELRNAVANAVEDDAADAAAMAPPGITTIALPPAMTGWWARVRSQFNLPCFLVGLFFGMWLGR